VRKLQGYLALMPGKSGVGKLYSAGIKAKAA
jgi:hypothetical protein